MRKDKTNRCYLCGFRIPSIAFKKLGWNILQCKSCGVYNLDFAGEYQQFIRTYYDRGFFTGGSNRAGYLSYEGDRKAEDKNMANYLKGVRRFVQSGELLDVGCATGLFMLQAEKAGFTVTGLDVSEYATRIAKRRFTGKIKTESIENALYAPRSFSVITLFDVIEHLEDPRAVLVKLHGYLKKNGILVLNTGDADSLMAKIQGKDWHFFIPPQHFFYFSKKTLTTLLHQAGFRVLAIDRKGKWVTLRYLFHLARQIQQDALAKFGFKLIGGIAPGKIPIYINLFDNITVYAVKKNNRTQKRNT